MLETKLDIRSARGNLWQKHSLNLEHRGVLWNWNDMHGKNGNVPWSGMLKKQRKSVHPHKPHAYSGRSPRKLVRYDDVAKNSPHGSYSRRFRSSKCSF